MAIFDFLRRSNTKSQPVGIVLNSPGILAGLGYHALTEAPEVDAAIGIIADLISSMTIHLMENKKNGDVRIRDQLSRKVDIEPWSLGTRHLWMSWIVRNMIVDGECVVIPQTAGDLILDLIPAPNASFCRDSGSMDYYALYNGHRFDSGNILHFRLRPDPDQPWRGMGLRIQLEQVVESIIQTAATKTAYMSSEYKPPVVFSVNADSPLSDPKERSAFIAKYLKRANPAEPLIVPADLMTISQIKPLSLTDLAIRDGVELDKKTVATVIGIPPFLLGVGTFNKEEYNAFISRRILPICRAIEQELTKKLLISRERYFKFNVRSLYAYSLQELSNISLNMRNAGLMTGNEGRDWIGLPPKPGLDELVMLENYVPADRLGDQKKLSAPPTQKEEPDDV